MRRGGMRRPCPTRYLSPCLCIGGGGDGTERGRRRNREARRGKEGAARESGFAKTRCGVEEGRVFRGRGTGLQADVLLVHCVLFLMTFVLFLMKSVLCGLLPMSA